MRVVFWQNILSFYQVPHITALAAHPGMEVTWVVEKALSQDRIEQGWKVPEVNGVEVIVAPDEAAVRALVTLRPDESVHIFSGIHQKSLIRTAFYQCVKTTARIGLLTEPPFPGRLRDLLSPVVHGVHRLFYGKRISFILAIGSAAVTFYHSVGYPSSIVFPYGYFPAAPSSAVSELPNEKTVRILYLGQLIERKGVDILLQSLGPLSSLDWALTLIGSGDQKEALVTLSKELGLESCVTFLSALENDAAMRLMEQSDFFVLPSRHDGWGVVVNEALLRGVPVLCSDHCGAADLLEEPWRGEVFEAGSVSALEAALRRWITHGKRTREEARKIQDWSRCIEGTTIADYLLQIMDVTQKPNTRLPRPLPPWRHAGITEAERSTH